MVLACLWEILRRQAGKTDFPELASYLPSVSQPFITLLMLDHISKKGQTTKQALVEEQGDQMQTVSLYL